MWADVTFLGHYPSGYTYKVPAPDTDTIRVGHLVVAPLRKRRVTGIVTRILSALPTLHRGRDIKPILSIPLAEPVVSSEVLEFYVWCAEYYQISLGGILKTAFPLPKGVLKGETLRIPPEGREILDQLGEFEAVPGLSLGDGNQTSLPLTPFLSRIEAWNKLLEWTDKGQIRWDYPGFQRYFVAKVPCYSMASGETPRVGPRGKEILAFVAERGVVTAEVLRNCFPRSASSVKRLLIRKALRVTYQPEDLTLPVRFKETTTLPPALSHEQLVVLSSIQRAIDGTDLRPILLHGVTGGGKTELYIQAIQETVRRGRSALILVPEIVLTPQLISRIHTRIKVPVVSWHSRLTGRERWRQWLLLHQVSPVVVIGVRSAVFTPVRRLGLIVVDEEHDPSFKQEEGLLYHARDVAVVRSRQQSIPLILGSATPSIESYHNVKRERFRYNVITRRPTGQPLPSVEVIDLREEGIQRFSATQGLMISRPLREALRRAYAAGRQSLLFLNRRGYARIVTCGWCGQPLSCPRCSVSLILHHPTRHLQCHYCAYTRPLPPKCERCGGPLIQIGGGTQRLEEEIRGIIPEATVARLDRDTVQKRAAYEALLSRLQGGGN